jgi:hypothetical protein
LCKTGADGHQAPEQQSNQNHVTSMAAVYQAPQRYAGQCVNDRKGIALQYAEGRVRNTEFRTNRTYQQCGKLAIHLRQYGHQEKDADNVPGV